ncbi:thioesterase family protein [Klugiella xanthotipulae]|uniref:Acyl-CoA thioester hydrolase n=1 Tax=Klugiella xanthotipulae TaxID=244735 RepID=A0A543HT39_9MICO|nr:acyl-CoA thioesterase [Klugiella xanthotipulae]TQM61444.1 acyl-CoA thioester hydrolase [Klugiella xanthotipulae]
MRSHVSLELRWADLDAYGHVNNAVMFRLLEEARIRLFWRPPGGSPGSATQVFDGSPESDTLMIIAQQQIEYRSMLPYLEHPIDIQMWIGSFGGSSFDLYYEVFGSSGSEAETLYARAMSTIVLVTTSSGSPRRFRPEERAALEPLLGAPVMIGRPVRA